MATKQEQELWDNCLIHGYLHGDTLFWVVLNFIRLLTGDHSTRYEDARDIVVNLKLRRAIDVDTSKNPQMAHRTTKIRLFVFKRCASLSAALTTVLASGNSAASIFSTIRRYKWKKQVLNYNETSAKRQASYYKLKTVQADTFFVKTKENDKRTDWNTVK